MEVISCMMRSPDKLACSFPVDLCSGCYWNNCSGLIVSLTSLFLNLHPLWEVKKTRNWPEGKKQQELAPCAEFDVVDCQIPSELLFSLGKPRHRPLCLSSNKHSALFPSLHPLFHLAQKMWCCLVFSLHHPNSYRHKPWQPSPVCLSSGTHMIIHLYNTHLFSALTRKALTKVVKHSSRKKMTTQNKYSAALSYLLWPY